jgi:hypothetical protein
MLPHKAGKILIDGIVPGEMYVAPMVQNNSNVDAVGAMSIMILRLSFVSSSPMLSECN